MNAVSPAIRATMQANRSKNTKPELRFRRELWANGLRGYRIHQKLPGKPDIVFRRYQLAIFINGCFWHRCEKCNLPIPKSNTEFWKDKFERNVRRDRENIKLLTEDGWNVLTIWECEIKSDIQGCIEKIKKMTD